MKSRKNKEPLNKSSAAGRPETDAANYETNKQNERNDITQTAGSSNTSAAESTAGQRQSGQRPRKRRRPVLIALDLLIVFLIAAGAYLLLKPYYVAWKQDQVMDELDELVQGTDEDKIMEGIWVDPNANAIEGEEMEYFGEGEAPSSVSKETEIVATVPTDEQGRTLETYEVPGWVQLVPIGQLQIDKIDLRLPLLEGAGVVPLRYGAGWYEKSAKIGSPGRATILGHAMLTNSRFFSRLTEVAIGDRIRIVKPNAILNYEVYATKLIPDWELGDYLINNQVSEEIMLVTCHNKPSWNQRFLVFARPVY